MATSIIPFVADFLSAAMDFMSSVPKVFIAVSDDMCFVTENIAEAA
jgi:hypothetical protein